MELGRPRFGPSRDRPSPADTPAMDPLPPAELPDIVLITLDAARADHCSCYGYPRPTTPMIDRFAELGLVFRNAFALAPYTLCSVPTMITGMSFLDHGVVGHQDTLAPEATTLAESLAAAGYRTACFSASPNDSAAKDSTRGMTSFTSCGRRRSAPPHGIRITSPDGPSSGSRRKTTNARSTSRSTTSPPCTLRAGGALQHLRRPLVRRAVHRPHQQLRGRREWHGSLDRAMCGPSDRLVRRQPARRRRCRRPAS